MSFGTINVAKAKEEENKPRGLDFSMRVAIVGSDGCGKTSFKDRFCFDRWVDPEEALLKAAKSKKKKKGKSGTIQPQPLPPIVYECGTKEILWSPSTGCHWEDDVKEKDGDLLVEVLMVDSFQKYKTLNHRRGYLRGAQVVAVLYDVGSRESFDEAKEMVQLVNEICRENGTLVYGTMGVGLSKMRGRIKTMDDGWGKPLETKDSIGRSIARTLDNETFVCGILVGNKCDKEIMTEDEIEQRKAEGKGPLHRIITYEEGDRFARDHGFFFHESSPLIDSDVNRNRTKNTVTQVWTTNSTANDAIQKTIGRCCCKWHDLKEEEHLNKYYPQEPLPPIVAQKEEEKEEDQYGAAAYAGGEGEYGQEGEYAAGEGEYGQDATYAAGEGGEEQVNWGGEENTAGAEGQYGGGEVEEQYGGEVEEQYGGEETEQYGAEEEQYGAEVEEPPVEAAVVEEEEEDY